VSTRPHSIFVVKIVVSYTCYIWLVFRDANQPPLQAAQSALSSAHRDDRMAGIYQKQVDEVRAVVETLQRRQATLERRQAQSVIPEEEISTLEQLAEWATPRLAQADQDFAARRQLIEALNLRFTLVWRGEQRIIVVKWRNWEFDVEVAYVKSRTRWDRRNGGV
jgi:hypothetical protein